RNAALDALDKGIALGSGGSRLLRGNSPAHEELESAARLFFGSEAAIFLGSGFSANSLLLSTLPQSSDLILHDSLSHASTHEGMRLSRAPHQAFAHNDADAAADAIARWRSHGGRGTPWLAFETLYSMDGDFAPVADFAALAKREGAVMLIDEAHATGVFGPSGRGLAADLHGQENAITLVTCGKALGCEGALVLCPAVVKDFLINRGRNFIFSTAPSPLMATVVREALTLVAAADDRRGRIQALIAAARSALSTLGLGASPSQIQPILIGDDARTMEIATKLQDRGFDIRGIRPPTVPAGTARLRMSITLNIDEAAIADLVQALGELF
ncbi:MAG: 8-amino-7-oxononanoate synthase, partial [Sphingomonadaceae bacterium]